MSCVQCSSLKEAGFIGELLLHVSGSIGAEKPGVLMFPKVLVCMDCGASRFNMPVEELRQLQGPA